MYALYEAASCSAAGYERVIRSCSCYQRLAGIILPANRGLSSTSPLAYNMQRAHGELQLAAEDEWSGVECLLDV